MGDSPGSKNPPSQRQAVAQSRSRSPRSRRGGVYGSRLPTGTHSPDPPRTQERGLGVRHLRHPGPRSAGEWRQSALAEDGSLGSPSGNGENEAGHVPTRSQ